MKREWGSIWYLLFLGYLFLQPAFDPEAGVSSWAVAGGSALLYVLFTLYASPAGHWSPALVAGLGVLVVPVNVGGTVFFVYAAAYAGMLLPRRAATLWLGGLTALVGASALVSSAPAPYLFLSIAPPLVSLWIVGLGTMEEADQRRATAELRVDNARIEHLATLSERERISRDLHDLLGQTLTGIVVRAQLAQRLPGADATAEMAVVETMARDALTEVRATVSGWRQVSVDDEITVARDALAAAGVELVVTRDDDLVLVPSAESALALALREAVTNVVRHADARRCTVALRSVDGRVELEVADDGVGGGTRDGNGLSGMRERIAALGGTVQRPARAGTALVVALPAVVAR
ncbi:sensor histidine kinase [Pseudonocardia abyssalis]|uniref:Sensor histidine kinase n=1 Tax=Pseudonocardia abyssalis TaxID=2792008 RepID=A0ABS6UM72_9PSEU|nr:sensor histidine kinase [Pseudonocardia abyssalis]MBW0115614.1 sensor histidine kinase [Pseudonocardia abyssalis]MBW0133343.1 sensor histidine kinase [Pseudonocardia abyssalis]